MTIDRKQKERKEIRNLEIISLHPVGKVWMGVENMHEISKGQSGTIKRTIMPEGAYQGGSDYGEYGGYDLALMELAHPVHTFQPACLPSPKFNDYADSKLAGYGKYFRRKRLSHEDVCQTNQYGRMKFHYCNSTCVTFKAPPSSSTCRAFFIGHEIPEDKEEVMIIKENRPEFCFRNENKENKESFKKCDFMQFSFKSDLVR